MNITLPPEAAQLIAEQIRAGRYTNAEDVVLAGLLSLAQTFMGDFAPGELDRLIAEGEASLEAEGTIDGEEAFAALKARHAVVRAREAI